MSIENGIRQDDTWIAVDPIVGCAKDCQYCFLQTYGATPKKGEIILTADQAIDNLVAFETYRPNSPVMLASETDAFMSKPNIAYYSDFLKRYDERNIGNTVALVTKCHVPDEFIELVKGLENTKVLFYLSYSGLPFPIEPTTNVEKLKQNFVRLSEAGMDVIHYWRPFLPQNSTPEKIQEVIDFVSQYARCSVAAGIKLNEGILERVKKYWPELAEQPINYSEVGAVWPEGTREYLDQYTRNKHPDYPLFWVNSCAVAYVLEQPEFNGIYGGHICEENHCILKQRQICGDSLIEYVPTEEQTAEALGKMGITTTGVIDAENKRVIVNEDISHGQAIYLRQVLKYPVVTSGEIHSQNEWGGPVIGRENLYVPYNKENFSIAQIWEDSQYVRNIFKEVERIDWNAETYGGELIVQVGHLSDIVLRQSHKLNRYSTEQNLAVISDEVCDVILNIFSIADFYNINIPSEINKYFNAGRYDLLDGSYLYRFIAENYSEEADPIRLMFDLNNECTNLINEVRTAQSMNNIDPHALLRPILSTFFNALRISKHFNIKLDKSFKKMVSESEVFIERNKNEHS